MKLSRASFSVYPNARSTSFSRQTGDWDVDSVKKESDRGDWQWRSRKLYKTPFLRLELTFSCHTVYCFQLVHFSQPKYSHVGILPTDFSNLGVFFVDYFLWHGTPIIIDLFINSDAILNRDALWSIQGKKHYLQAAIVGGIRHKGKILRWTFS